MFILFLRFSKLFIKFISIRLLGFVTLLFLLSGIFNLKYSRLNIFINIVYINIL